MRMLQKMQDWQPPVLHFRVQNKNPVISDWVMELMTRIELVNLILTKDALYRLSYISTSVFPNDKIYITLFPRKMQ